MIDRPDSGFYPSHGRYLVDHIPGARLLALAGTDLPSWLGDSAAMLSAIEEFVTSRSRPTASTSSTGVPGAWTIDLVTA
jgi:hypothetical protein